MPGRSTWRKFDFEVANEEWLDRLNAGGRPAQARRPDVCISIDGMSAEEIATEILARAEGLKG